MKTVYKAYIDYGSGYGWVPISWAPTFDTKEEAEAWVQDDKHEWESRVDIHEVKVDKEEEDYEDSWLSNT